MEAAVTSASQAGRIGRAVPPQATRLPLRTFDQLDGALLHVIIQR